MTILIHNKEYVTVAERLEKAKDDLVSINTEVLYTEPRVVIKATVVTKKGTFTGISAANALKSIEKESPYEVAETSAVGRALAFAGYETTGGIASAEEMQKATVAPVQEPLMLEEPCPDCGKQLKQIISQKNGKTYIMCTNRTYNKETKAWEGCKYFKQA
jgi:hypothetical protein